MPDLAPSRRALISVSDKTGLLDLARALAGQGVELLSTGGTAGMMREAGLAVTRRGRRDRLPRDDGRPGQDPASGGAWRPAGAARQCRALAAMAAHGIAPIDLLVVNLYPFEATVAQGRRLRRPASRTSTSAARR